MDRVRAEDGKRINALPDDATRVHTPALIGTDVRLTRAQQAGGLALIDTEGQREFAKLFGGVARVLAHPCKGFFMVLSWEQVVIDARDPRSLGHWWARALDWVVVSEDDDEVEIRSAADVTPGLLFLPVPEERVVKNRLHLDFRPDDQAAEVRRLLDLGAVQVDIGQGDVSWVVLSDPEGNEFCILGSTMP